MGVAKNKIIFFFIVTVPFFFSQPSFAVEKNNIATQVVSSKKAMPFTILPLKEAQEKSRNLVRKKTIPITLLPRDKYGMVDWAEGVRRGIMNPLSSINETAKDEKPLDLDIIIRSKKRFMTNVLFPHDTHTYWLSCKICHPGIFAEKKGGNPKMTMWKIVRGKYCGRCHGRVAFPLRECYRCHMPRIPENFPRITKTGKKGR